MTAIFFINFEKSMWRASTYQERVTSVESNVSETLISRMSVGWKGKEEIAQGVICSFQKSMEEKRQSEVKWV